MTIRFGLAGIPCSCDGNTEQGIKCCKELGLSAMEIEFVRQVYLSKNDAVRCKQTSEELSIKLSAHAPYWINCCSKEKHKQKKSISYIFDSAKALSYSGGGVVVFHVGFYQGRKTEEVRPIIIETLNKVFEKLNEEKIDNIILGPEYTGKQTQFGNLDDLIFLSNHFGLKKIKPVIDFGHYHARNKGILKSKNEYLIIFESLEKELGKKAIQKFHTHFSEVEYGEKGERKHIPLGSNSPPFKPLAQLCFENGYSGTIICESPLLEKDALKMKRIYESIKNKE